MGVRLALRQVQLQETCQSNRVLGQSMVQKQVRHLVAAKDKFAGKLTTLNSTAITLLIPIIVTVEPPGPLCGGDHLKVLRFATPVASI